MYSAVGGVEKGDLIMAFLRNLRAGRNRNT
jgi:hypothetical protein